MAAHAGATGTPPEGGAGVGNPDRVLTIPNLVTTVRIGCIPIFVALMLQPHRRFWLAAAIMLGVLGATDGVDGFLARRLHQVSTVGKVLDPVADRLLLVTAAVTTIALGAVPVWVAALALAREVVVAVGTLAVYAAGARRIDVRVVGKAGTFLLMTALPLLLAGHSHISWHRVPELLGWACALPGLALAWMAAVSYVPDARRALAEGRRGSGPTS